MMPRYRAALRVLQPTLSAAKTRTATSAGSAKKAASNGPTAKRTAPARKTAAKSTGRAAATKTGKSKTAAVKTAPAKTAAVQTSTAKAPAASKSTETKAATTKKGQGSKAATEAVAGKSDSSAPKRQSGASPSAVATLKRAATTKPSGSIAGGRRKPLPKGLKYKVGQQVVYPLQGVGNVERIEERTFRDQTLLYYIVYLEVSDMTVMVPTDKTEELGIRAIVPKTEANKALKLITEEDEPIPTDWKLRYQMNLDLLKEGAVTDIATVVRALYHRSQIKELPILERKLYDTALKLLVDEVSFSLDKEKDKVEEMIFERLDEGISQAAAK